MAEQVRKLLKTPEEVLLTSRLAYLRLTACSFFEHPEHYKHFFSIHQAVIKKIQRGDIPQDREDEILPASQIEHDARGRPIRKRSEQEKFLQALPESFFMTRAYAAFVEPFQDRDE